MADVLTIEQYLSGKVRNINVPDNAIATIIMDAGITSVEKPDKDTDISQLSLRERELCLAWLYVWVAGSPTQSGGYTEQDADWQSLERALGMSAGDAAAMDWRGHVAHSMFTMKGDTCALNLLLGGYFDSYWGMGTSKWRHMGTYGYYWTATIDSAKAGQYYFFRKVAYNRNAVYRQSMEPSTYMLSVRYVRDDH